MLCQAAETPFKGDRSPERSGKGEKAADNRRHCPRRQLKEMRRGSTRSEGGRKYDSESSEESSPEIQRQEDGGRERPSEKKVGAKKNCGVGRVNQAARCGGLAGI